MPCIETKPKQTTKNKETTVSPGMLSEMRLFYYVRKGKAYGNIA